MPIDPKRVLQGVQLMTAVLGLDGLMTGADSADKALTAGMKAAATLGPVMLEDPDAVRALMALAETLLRLRHDDTGKTPKQTLQEIALKAADGT
ncbi:hypothetical protein ACIHCQ_19810 [Streptomyces sp. NPDC052236]|uniref:hypothetical protein n=1 Tax=Streptomyces sp. NPDC052236 TaxID=3365686 RepID=UPI0037CEA71C